MAFNQSDPSRGVHPGILQRLFRVVRTHRSSGNARNGALDVDVMYDTGACLACQDYAILNEPFRGETRRLHGLANGALGTFPH